MHRYQPVIRSLEDLERKPDYHLIVQKYTSIWSEMMVSIMKFYYIDIQAIKLIIGINPCSL